MQKLVPVWNEILQDPCTNQYPPLLQKLAAGSQQCYTNARTNISSTHYYLSMSITCSLQAATNSVKQRSLNVMYLLLMFSYNIIGIEVFFTKLSLVLPN